MAAFEQPHFISPSHVSIQIGHRNSADKEAMETEVPSLVSDCCRKSSSSHASDARAVLCRQR
jgi:hypothetical protein